MDSGLPCIRYGDLYTHHNFVVKDFKTQISAESASRYTTLEKGDILFAASGESIDEIGKSVLFNLDETAYCGGDNIICKTGGTDDSDFLGFATNAPYFAAQKSMVGRGFTVLHIYGTQLRDLRLALPPIKERKAISNFISQNKNLLDSQIRALENLLPLLEEKRSALITKAVTKGLNPDVTMKDSGIGKIPEHWEVINLRYLLKHKITDGPHETPVFVDEGFPFLSVDGIQEGELVFEGCRFISQKDHIEYSRKVKPMKGDLLMGKAASTGKIAQVKVDFEFSIWSPLAWIRPNNMITSDFLEFALKGEYIQSQVEMLCTISTQKNISMQDIPRIKVIIPPKAEQKEISDYIKKSTSIISEQKQILTRQILKLKEYRTALISAAVTGKIDVRGL